MTQSLESLTRQSDSMRGIRSVVHTMKTLSVINTTPYDHAARAIEAYHQTVLTGLQAFLIRHGPIALTPPTIETDVLVAFGSDHGLCGNYNEALAAEIADHLHHRGGPPPQILCIGAKMADALRDQGFPVQQVFFPPASVEGIGRLAKRLTESLDQIATASPAGDLAVSLAYFARDDRNLRRADITALLPLDSAFVQGLAQKPWDSRSLPTFTMPPDELFTALIQGHLFASLFRAAAEALVTENAARLALMQQAEQSVDERLEDLVSDMRTVRQAEITSELLDVIIGFEALKKKPAQTELSSQGEDTKKRRP